MFPNGPYNEFDMCSYKAEWHDLMSAHFSG